MIKRILFIPSRFFSVSGKVPKEGSWRELLQDSEYIKENLYKISEDQKALSSIFQAFIEETNQRKQRPSAHDFELLYFRNLVKLISCYVQTHKEKLPEMPIGLLVENLGGYARLFERFGGVLRSSKTILFTNKTWKSLYDRRTEISRQDAVRLLEIMALLDYKNGKFTDIVLDIIKKEALSLERDECLKVIRALSQMKFRKEDLVEIVVDRIYPRIKDIDPKDVALLALNLSRMRFKVNKHFLKALIQRVHESLPKDDRQTLALSFSAFCSLETLIAHKLFYIDEYDQYYEDFVHRIQGFIEDLELKEVGYLANSLQKIAVYDEPCLRAILGKARVSSDRWFKSGSGGDGDPEYEQDMLESLEKLDKSSNEYKAKLIEYKRLKLFEINLRKPARAAFFEHIIRIIHCFGVLYYEKSRPFLLAFLARLRVFLSETPANRILKLIDLRLISRFLYSCAILLPAQEFSAVAARLLTLLANESGNYVLDISDKNTLRILHLYFKRSGTEESFPEPLIKSLTEDTKENFKSEGSYLSIEVARVLENMGIPCKLEPILEGEAISVDILTEYNGRTVFIDVHGFQHYLRNIERLKGGGVLKTRILKTFGGTVKYVIIPVFEWQLLAGFEEKRDYLIRIL